MKLIFNSYNIRIELINIFESNGRVYSIFHIHNDSSDSASLYVNSCLYGDIPFRYYSKSRGVFDQFFIFPYNPSRYDIPAGCFKEIQISYDAPEINKGDEFDIQFAFFCLPKNLTLRFRFKCIENGWEITSTPSYKAEEDFDYEEFKELKETVYYADKEELANDSITSPYEKLNSLIGLSSVKKEVMTLANFVKIQKLRESKGLKVSPISYHCVFTGNPGTGKTTVARIVASIYKSLGILKKGHLIETDRSGLVGNYIGHTATKTNAVIDSALDGVLFIDEAYALVPPKNPGYDFGLEAIATLLKRMEDDRDRLIVIIAGYSKEMKDFIDSNSGLKSRFVRYIDFPDYNTEELNLILNHFLEEGGYTIDKAALPELKKEFDEITSSGDKDYGNGRYIRNLYEEALKAQANRLVTISEVKDDELSLITIDDIITALSKVSSNIK